MPLVRTHEAVKFYTPSAVCVRLEILSAASPPLQNFPCSPGEQHNNMMHARLTALRSARRAAVSNVAPRRPPGVSLLVRGCQSSCASMTDTPGIAVSSTVERLLRGSHVCRVAFRTIDRDTSLLRSSHVWVSS